MKAQAPGKLILSGEHSVVYGAPALAIAVSQSVTASFTDTGGGHLRIQTAPEVYQVLPLADLSTIKATLNARFERFLKGDCTISQLFDSSSDLLFYTLADAGMQRSGDIVISSNIPIGAGMGSSAAVIAALWALTKAVMQQPYSRQQLFEQVRFCERLQHGRGSAIDAAAVTYGGCVRVQSDQVTPLPITLDDHWYVWNSGTPCNTTGETVAEVRRKFAESAIWTQFSAVTEALENALLDGNRANIRQWVQANHTLLEQIGVVPDGVSEMIRRIEQQGGAAKLCGAGTLRGEAGGQVLIYLPDNNHESLVQQGLSITPLRQRREGGVFVSD